MNMLPFPPACVAVLAVLVSILSELSGQEGSAYHQFSDKKGQKVSALVLGVSADNQKMKIRREDGQEFEMVINLLSLDDQQYLKDWMKTRPLAQTAPPVKSAFRLQTVITRQAGATEKHAGESRNMEEKANFFRVVVRNLSRETLEGAELAYAVVWDDRAIIYKTSEGQWTYTYPDEDEPVRVKIEGVLPLGPLRFNGEASLETAPGNIDTVFLDGSEVYRQDEMIGIKVRVRAKDGTVIHEADYGSASIASMGWDEIEALTAPQVIN